MTQFEVSHLNFAYSTNDLEVLHEVSFSVQKGEFLAVCGKSGCGKTTLLKLLKPEIAPKGTKTGKISYCGSSITELLDLRVTASEIGFVGQNPDYQIVTHTAQAELCFALENLGFDSNIIALRIAEISAYFSMNAWLNTNVNELSGGQKQLLSLASVLVLYPKVLILDEPTSQLDPMASEIFIDTIKKINHDLGISIIITEHRLENILPICDNVLLLHEGKKIYHGKVQDIFKSGEDLSFFTPSLPTPMRVFSKLNQTDFCPITISEGKLWLENLINKPKSTQIKPKISKMQKEIIQVKNLFFKYETSNTNVLKGLNLSVKQNTIHAILGSNAVGKTTLLKLITGLIKPTSGKIKIDGKNIKKLSDIELYNNLISVMPQKIETMFSEETVYLQLMSQLENTKLNQTQKEEKISEISNLLGLNKLHNHHPYDISGGQMQKLGLALVLLQNPKIIVLDEPTKGMDAEFKIKLAKIFETLKEKGITIVLISHDTEFCASYCDECSLMFDGKIAVYENSKKFFANNFFFTTRARKMSREVFENAITCEEVIALCKENLHTS